MNRYVFSEDDFNRFILTINPRLSLTEIENQKESVLKLSCNNLPYLYNNEHLASLTGISIKQLNLFLSYRYKAYCTFKLPKKNGSFRTIDAPNKNMKNLQRWALDNILYKLNFGEYAHGFIPKRSIRTNAEIHVGQDLVMGIDIKDFFPSIKFYRVLGLFRSIGYNDEMSCSLAEICTYKSKLPQGAPTSPAIANLIAWHIDMRLSGFCHKRNLKYSRYADDITISGGKILPKYKSLILKKIEEEGFQINYDKVRIHGKGSCQKVTGVVVNDRLSIGKEKKRLIRAIVNNVKVKGPCSANNTDDPFFKEKIFGLLSFANMIDPDFAQPLINELSLIDWNKYSSNAKSGIESELNLRSLKKVRHLNIVHFNNLKPFTEIKPVPSEVKIDPEFRNRLKNLAEKCNVDVHGIDSCANCLDEKTESYEKCLKYILGHYLGSTGGHHHGHEGYDIGKYLECASCPEINVFVAFLLKSKRGSAMNDSLFHQFFNCANNEEIDIVSIVTQHELDHNLSDDIRKVMRKCASDKHYCLICKNEMEQILYDFIQNHSIKK